MTIFNLGVRDSQTETEERVSERLCERIRGKPLAHTAIADHLELL